MLDSYRYFWLIKNRKASYDLVNVVYFLDTDFQIVKSMEEESNK